MMAWGATASYKRNREEDKTEAAAKEDASTAAAVQGVNKGKIDSVVIVAPKGAYLNWSTKEIPEHMPEHVLAHVAVWAAQPRKKDKEAQVSKRTNERTNAPAVGATVGLAVAMH